jgi:hypothetical protein
MEILHSEKTELIRPQSPAPGPNPKKKHFDGEIFISTLSPSYAFFSPSLFLSPKASTILRHMYEFCGSDSALGQ